MCTEECGRPAPPNEQQLIDTFRSVAHDAFSFLADHYALLASELVTYELGETGRTPVDATEASYPFLAVVEFTGANRPVRLSYGRRDYGLDLEIGANGSGFHPLASWLDALGIPHVSSDDSGLATPSAVARHAERLAHLLADHFTAVSEAGHEVVERLPSLGARTAPRLNRTRERAHSAFADGDYGSYVALLAPFEAALTVTERRKLEFARARS